MKRTVVVVDDKPLIRQSIVQTIDWDKLNCMVVGQAEDGIEGKRLILEQQPDILITDIKMPGLSGLDLAAYMHATFPLSKTILITGYQDFEYAQRAVRLGVYDFIVKPVRNEELQRVIGLAVEEMEGRDMEIHHLEQMAVACTWLEARHQSSLPSLRSKFIAELISGSVPLEPDLDQTAADLAITGVRNAIVIVRSKQTAATVQGVDSTRIHSGIHRSLTEMAQAAAAKREFQIIESYPRDDLVFACLFPKVLTPRELRMKLQGFCHDFIELVRLRHGLHCCIAVSSAYKLLPELKPAFAEASALMESSFFRTEEPVLFPEPRHHSIEGGKFSIIRDLEQFNQMLEHASSEEMIAHLEQFLEQIQVYCEGNILVAKGLLSDVCLVAARYYFRVTGDEFGLNKSIDEILEDVYRLPNMKEASDYLAAFVKNIKGKLEGSDKQYSLVVKKSIDYINSHFSENISLTAVAEHFGLSPSYLSRLLRTETGINFVDLVYKARIEAAKRLLKDPKHKVNEVGEMVGYKEYAYFYQVFKKVEGISPKEYKNRSKES
ncbi:response regulator transcription factor [Paenibacillus spongiae]|uniref:Response regulator n=1 Tax=Paenibacillus spongiae TaxID=2909671 RepID=A0ABY5SFP9_9BACL|nr:response regulator [Paenibacillus spongiae]UVI32801.1 response regulator [Paenibacillus spongiae]